MKTIIAILTLAFATAVSAETCMPTQNVQLRELDGKQYISVDYREPTPTTIEVSYVEYKHIDAVVGMVLNKYLAGVDMDKQSLISGTNGIVLVYERQGNNIVCEVEPSKLNTFVESTTQWFKLQKETLKSLSKSTALKTANFLYDYAGSNE